MHSESSEQPGRTFSVGSLIKGILLAPQVGPILALAVVILFFATWGHFANEPASFLSLSNFRTVTSQTLTVAVAALGMTLVIIAGGIDLSAGSAVALSAVVLALTLREGASPLVAVGACLLTGAATGFINGCLISSLKIVPFIVTLGTMTIYLGTAKLLAKSTTVRPERAQIPAWMPELVTPNPSPAPWQEHLGIERLFANGAWIVFGLAAILALVLSRTVFGRHVFAIGSSEPTARLCGIRVDVTKVAVYVISGLFVGIAGLYQFSRLSEGNPMSGVGLELKIIAAVVIGGGSLSGGAGSVVGTLCGAAITQFISSGCTFVGVSNHVQDIIIGAIIIAAVMIDQVRQRRVEG